MRPPMIETPCPRCLKLAIDGVIDVQMVMPMPAGAFAPRGHNKERCCYDCASADSMVRRLVPEFEMARVAVGNDRQECLRLPFPVADAMGLIAAGWVRNWPNTEDFEAHLKWLDTYVWPLIPNEEGRVGR